MKSTKVDCPQKLNSQHRLIWYTIPFLLFAFGFVYIHSLFAITCAVWKLYSSVKLSIVTFHLMLLTTLCFYVWTVLFLILLVIPSEVNGLCNQLCGSTLKFRLILGYSWKLSIFFWDSSMICRSFQSNFWQNKMIPQVLNISLSWKSGVLATIDLLVHVCDLFISHIVSWEPEGRYCSSKMFRWKPEGRYCCTKSMVIAPFWFSIEHLCTAITPFWLSTDDI